MNLFAKFEAGFQLAWVVGALIPVVIPMSDTVGFIVLAIMSATAGVAYGVLRLREPPEPVKRSTAVAVPEPQP